MTYRYRQSNQECSSAKLGNCEVCGLHCSEVWLQTEERFCRLSDGRSGWTQHKCSTLFGHKECLDSKQRGGYISKKVAREIYQDWLIEICEYSGGEKPFYEGEYMERETLAPYTTENKFFETPEACASFIKSDIDALIEEAENEVDYGEAMDRDMPRELCL